ncbi:MAG: hypothetical protein OHK0017_13690 [Patescibacteria group bacterium]
MTSSKKTSQVKTKPNYQLTKPANRMVIGDVGSGKTMVAFMSMLSYLESAYQNHHELSSKKSWITAMMVPTEVLATQHYQGLLKLKQTLELDWLNVCLLTNKQKLINGHKLTPKEFQKQTNELTQNGYSCWVGTQALLFKSDLIPDLIFTDEQHRFGVRQRQAMADAQQDLSAHFISMTATPIPRTLALTVYGDLDVSFVQRINSRKPISTSLVQLSEFEQIILPVLQAQLSAGRKVFVICPAIETKEEGDEEDNLWTLDKAEVFLRKLLPAVGTLKIHGRQKEKDEFLTKFRDDNSVQILISTTVVEVGVDVSEATVMLILNPERFGLAQLHQIRGRVGRNDYEQNFCFLITDEEAGKFIPRLQFLCKSQDGFEIAQEDLRLRGQGDLYGVAQSGAGSDMLGLEMDEYQQIREAINQIDFQNLEKDLPDLNIYLKQSADQVWGE